MELCTYAAGDGDALHYRHWRPAGQPRARIVALHGIQSHSGWYEWSSARLCEAGYEVLFLDRRGSGLNEELRGDAPSATQLIDDVVQSLTSRVESSTPADRCAVRIDRTAVGLGRESNAHGDDVRCPTILLAVSWGGKLAAAIAARHPQLIDALVLMYPGIRARVQATAWQNVQLSLAQVLGIRRKRVPIPLRDPALFTADADWQAFIRDDPLALHEVTVSFLLANRDLDRLADSAPEAIRCPTLLMLAGRDQIVDNTATRKWLSRIPAEKTVIEYPAAQHTLEFEPNREQILRDQLGWMVGVPASAGP